MANPFRIGEHVAGEHFTNRELPLSSALMITFSSQ
jgi:hypothetical protein